MSQISISEASRNLSHWINQASYGRDLIVITSRGKAKAILIGADSFEALIGMGDYAHRELMPAEQLRQQFRQALMNAGYADREAIVEMVRKVKQEKRSHASDKRYDGGPGVW